MRSAGVVRPMPKLSRTLRNSNKRWQNATEQNRTEQNTTQHNTTQHNTTQHNATVKATELFSAFMGVSTGMPSFHRFISLRFVLLCVFFFDVKFRS
eukprot:COSAG06_NODE_837_length_12033_cov_4.155574_9_plen_96_part_00